MFIAILTESEGGLTTWRTTGAGMVGAALLAAAALSPRTVVRDSHKAIAIAAGGSLAAFVLLSLIASVFEFPGALTDRPETESELQLLTEHPALVVADFGAAASFLIAGAAFARRAEREADEFHMWLGIGATIAAIGYLNYALSPSSYTDFFYAGDLFRAAAVVAFGIGAIREFLRYQAVYAPAAVLDERRRMARDLHDGVAQELAFIASRIDRLAKRSDDEQTVTEISDAVQRALEESRQAISTLDRPLEEPLHIALANTAKEASARRGPGGPALAVIGLATLAVAILPGTVLASQQRLDASVEALRQGDCTAALAEARRAVDVLGVRPEAHEVMGICLARAGDFGGAAATFERARERDPDNWGLHASLAAVLAADGRDPRAAARAALARNPREPLARQLAERLGGSKSGRWRRVGRELARDLAPSGRW